MSEALVMQEGPEICHTTANRTETNGTSASGAHKQAQDQVQDNAACVPAGWLQGNTDGDEEDGEGGDAVLITTGVTGMSGAGGLWQGSEILPAFPRPKELMDLATAPCTVREGMIALARRKKATLLAKNPSLLALQVILCNLESTCSSTVPVKRSQAKANILRRFICSAFISITFSAL
jgi:hypothetical protein